MTFDMEISKLYLYVLIILFGGIASFAEGFDSFQISRIPTNQEINTQSASYPNGTDNHNLNHTTNFENANNRSNLSASSSLVGNVSFSSNQNSTSAIDSNSSSIILILQNSTELNITDPDTTQRESTIIVKPNITTFPAVVLNITLPIIIFGKLSVFTNESISIDFPLRNDTNSTSTVITKTFQISNSTGPPLYNRNTTRSNTPANTSQRLKSIIAKPPRIVIKLGQSSLSDVCLQLNIPKERCKCPDLGQLCLFFKDDKRVEKILVCSKAHKVKTYSIIVICSIGIIGNLLCLFVTMVNEKNTICRKVIGMLAFADLVFSCLQLTVVVPGIWSCQWEYNDHVCKFLYSIINSTAIMALGFILIISMERFNGIVKPFMNQSSNAKITIMSVVNVSLALLFVVPTIIVSKVEHIDDAALCKEQWPDKRYSLYYSWFLMIVTFIIPIVAITFLYMGIVKSLRKSQNHTRKTFSLKEQSRRRKEDGKITMIISYLLISFAVLVSPNRIVWVLYDHDVFKNVSADTLAYIRMAALVPYTIHACINPIIYSLVDKKFRGNLKYIFLRVTCQKRSAVHVKNKHKGSFNHSERDTSLSKITKSTIRKTSTSLPPPPPYESAKTSAIKLDSNTQ